MVFVRTNKTFVYGHFFLGGPKKGLNHRLHRLAMLPDAQLKS